MEGIIIPGVPAEYAAIITTVIGFVAGWLTEALTAIAKKAGRTSGVTTVTVSAVLSLLVSLGFTVAGVLNGGEANLPQALVIALIAFVKSNGGYLLRKQANASANREAAPIAAQPAPAPQQPVTPPPGIEAGKPLPAEYVEPQAAKKAPSLRIEK